MIARIIDLRKKKIHLALFENEIQIHTEIIFAII